MATWSILKDLKEIIGDLVDNNGNFRTLPIGSVGRRRLSNNRIKLMQDIVRLLRDTNIISEETKMYVFNRHITIKGVNQAFMDKTGEFIKFKSTSSKIQYDKSKLEKMFTNRVFVDILTNRDITVYERAVAEQFSKYSKNNLRDGLILDISKDGINRELTDEEFQEFITIVAPYVKSHVEFISKNIDKRLSGYFNYITSMPKLNEVDKERLDMLKTLILGE